MWLGRKVTCLPRVREQGLNVASHHWLRKAELVGVLSWPPGGLCCSPTGL